MGAGAARPQTPTPQIFEKIPCLRENYFIGIVCGIGMCNIFKIMV